MLDKVRRDYQPEWSKGKTLIICPLATVKSWTEQYVTWTNLNVVRVNNRNREPFLDELVLQDADVYITHWAGLRLMPELAHYHWFHVVADEVHNIQSRKSKQTNCLKEIPTLFKTGLSGTPAYDKPDDLWSILNWLYPTFWTSYWAYFDRYVKWVDFNGYKTIIGVENEEELQMQMRGFFIRRRKEEVLHDLPDLLPPTKLHVDLTPKQKRAYESMKKDMLAWVGENEDKPINASVVIVQLTRLQQFACAHAEYIKVQKPRRIEKYLLLDDRSLAIQTQVDQGFEVDGQGYIYHQDGTRVTDTVERLQLTDPSSKIDTIIDLLDTNPGQFVIFSQFSQVIELLCKRLDKYGITNGKYVGKTRGTARDQIVKDFAFGKIRVFAGTLGAGGTGLDGLQVANKLIFIDRSWSASVNQQAIGRLHRIGQESAVQVIDIIANGTIDAKRMEQIEMSWGWIKQLLGEQDE